MKDNLKRVNIEITSKCNYVCSGCPTHNLLRGKGSINSDLFRNIFDEIGNNVERIFLWNYGEPLLHPNVSELIRYGENFSAKKVLSSNGWKLDDLEDIQSLTKLDELIISINGFTQEVYSQHQKNGSLKKVVRGLERIAPLMADSKTRYILQTVAHKGNLNEIPLAETFAKKYKFDMLVVKSFNVMDRNQETFDKFVPLGTEFSRYKNGLNDFTKKHNHGISPCEEAIVINWDGSVNPCCWDYFGEHNFGNVKDRGVYAIWNYISYYQHRNNIKNNKFLKICVDCANSKTVSTISLTDKGGDDVKKSI